MIGRLLLFGFFTLLIGGLAHAQLGIWALAAFPRLRRHKRGLRAALVVLTLMGPLARLMVSKLHGEWVTIVFVGVMTEYLCVIFAALPIALLRIVTDLVSRAHARITRKRASVADPRAKDPPTADPVPASVKQDAKDTPDPPTPPSPSAPSKQDVKDDPPRLGRRQVVEAIGGSAFLAVSGGALGWGAARGRHAFVVEEVAVRVPNLPKALDGYVIGQISDVHVGASVGERELAEGLSRLAEVKADLVVCTGDLVDFDPAYVPQMARALASIRARDGVHAILGNHDYYTGALAVIEALRGVGVTTLVNDGRVIRAGDGGGFALLGVDDLWAHRYGGAQPSLEQALAAVPRDLPRVLLSHQPSTLDLWEGKVALQLSGHTHGGQINPGFRPADAIMRYVAGRYEAQGTTLWVNRGFGVAGPPARLGAPPEVTKIVLVAA